MKTTSLNILAWQKLKAEKMYFSALLFIVLCVFVGVFAVPLSPDKSPMANQMHIELATLKPFTKVAFLEIPKEDVNQAPFFEGIFFGKPSAVKRIPISVFSKTNDGVNYLHTNLKWNKRILESAKSQIKHFTLARINTEGIC